MAVRSVFFPRGLFVVSALLGSLGHPAPALAWLLGGWCGVWLGLRTARVGFGFVLSLSYAL